MRKIEKLVTTAVRDIAGEMTPIIIVACDDGTLWQMDYYTERWEEMKPVPQTKSEYDLNELPIQLGQPG